MQKKCENMNKKPFLKGYVRYYRSGKRWRKEGFERFLKIIP
jgi:hypothetical protein